MQLTDKDIRDAVMEALHKAGIFDFVESEIVIVEQNSDGNGRWHLLPLGPTHGYWYPDGEVSILICDGLMDIYPNRYYCDVCEEAYEATKEAYENAWDNIDPDTPGVIGGER